MRVWALWHGGTNYRPSAIPDDVETFPSLTSACEALEDRYVSNGRYPVEFNYVTGTQFDYVPVVELDSEMHVFLSDPDGDTDAYPDRVVKLTRNGRAKVERY